MRTTLHLIYHSIRQSSRKCREHASHSAKPDVSVPETSDLHHSKFICKRNRRYSRNIRCCNGRYMVIHRMKCCVLQVIAFPYIGHATYHRLYGSSTSSESSLPYVYQSQRGVYDMAKKLDLSATWAFHSSQQDIDFRFYVVHRLTLALTVFKPPGPLRYNFVYVKIYRV